MQNERKVLVSALLKAEKQGYSNIILNSVLKEAELSSVSKAFVTSVFYGVLERKISIDYLLNMFLKKPIDKAPPYTAAVLRSAAYQIVFMQKIPNSAAVNEAVKLIKRSKESGNSGLVNAVLRKLSTRDYKAEIYNSSSNGIKYSVKDWIYNMLCSEYGDKKAEAFFENSLLPPPIFIRLNTLKNNYYEKVFMETTSLEGELISTKLKDCFEIKGVKDVTTLDSYKNGYFFVQDYSSRICALIVGAKSGMRVLDCCAAPGGKSFSMAIDMENQGEIVSADIHSHRVGLIKNGAERLGLDCVKAIRLDATVFNESLGLFDRVLCDVPCSGIGVIRRKPEIKYKSDDECKNLLDIQKSIINTAANYVKVGGRLIYSTCTLLKRENEKIVEDFLKSHNDFSLVPVFGSDEKLWHTWMPPKDLGDGFFAAVLERS